VAAALLHQATSGGGGGGGFIETYVYNIKNDWPIIIGKGGFNGSSDAYAGYPTSAFGLEAAGGGTGVHNLQFAAAGIRNWYIW
jgi:hypothetical protein